jgi:hypothetical protein
MALGKMALGEMALGETALGKMALGEMVIHRRFYVLNMPISTTAPIDAKTHV